jgi:uncharacterized protein (TIGR03435 family)
MRKDDPELAGLNYVLVGERASMAMLCADLQDQLRRPVVDHTGLTGDYDFEVNYVADQLGGAAQSQLGLKLEAARGPIETLFIEHVELS